MKWCVLLSLLIAVFPAVANGQGRWVEMGITAPEMAKFFQQHAGSQDIARVDHPNDIGLISGVTVGRKMVIFKSVSQIQQFLASNARALDIVGYNLEPGQTHDAAELANPVAAAKAVQAVAQQYGKKVAIGLTKSLTNQYGPAMAPYADIWILQVQKAQENAPEVIAWVKPMSEKLKAANPNVEIGVQVRTDSEPKILAALVAQMPWLEGVSILTQRSDANGVSGVRDAVNVASAFFGNGSQVQAISSQAPTWNGDYGYRLSSKDGKWRLPVATRLLGSTDDDHVKRGSINSWDLSAAVGSPVFAAAPGVVEAAGCYLYENHKWPIMQGYGCAVQIKHGPGVSTQYGHCLENSIRVEAGDQVTADTLLCQVGRTGVTSFSHTHFTILHNGSPVRMDSIFDKGLMHYCHLCSGKNEPQATVANSVVGQQQAAVNASVTSKGSLLLQAIAALPAEQFAMLVSILVGVLMVAWWLFGLYVRVAIVALVTTVVVAGCMIVLFMPIQAQATNASQQPTSVGGDWVKSYEITQGREGWQCTRDGAYTMGGVTQGTYTRWLAKHGMGSADVCKALTREQAKQIFYELFWLPIGADKMPFALAVTAVDHYYNTGRVSHLLAQCGTDVKCFNDARIVDYRTKSNCAVYCNAWISRVNHIRTLTEK